MSVGWRGDGPIAVGDDRVGLKRGSVCCCLWPVRSGAREEVRDRGEQGVLDRDGGAQRASSRYESPIAELENESLVRTAGHRGESERAAALARLRALRSEGDLRLLTAAKRADISEVAVLRDLLLAAPS